MKAIESEQKFGGMLEACGHHISFNYWDFQAELTPELEAELTEAAEERARECIAEDYVSGELNFYNAATEEEIRGWWNIDNGGAQ